MSWWSQKVERGEYTALLSAGGASVATGPGSTWTSATVRPPEVKPSAEELNELADKVIAEFVEWSKAMQEKYVMNTDTKTKPAKMDASKENAKKVIDILDAATTVDLGDLGSGEGIPKADFDTLCDFVNAAFRRLPAQKAIDKDKKRKKAYAGNRKKKPSKKVEELVAAAVATPPLTLEPEPTTTGS